MVSSVRSLRTNVTAKQVSSNLERTAAAVTEARTRVATGNKLVKPLTDVGNFSMSVRLATAMSSAMSTSRNLQSLLSFSQTQESYLRELSKILVRMNELVQRVADPLKSAEDRGMFVRELTTLADEIEAIGNARFNGSELFKQPAEAGDPGTIEAEELTGSLQSDADPLEGVNSESEFSKLSVELGNSRSVSVTKFSLNTLAADGTNTLYDIVSTFGRIGSGRTPEQLASYLVRGSLDLSNATDEEIAEAYNNPEYTNEQLDVALNYRANRFPVALEQVNAMLTQNRVEQAAIQSAMSGEDDFATNLSTAYDSVTGTDLAAETKDMARLSLISRAAASVFYESNQSNAYLLKLL